MNEDIFTQGVIPESADILNQPSPRFPRWAWAVGVLGAAFLLFLLFQPHNSERPVRTGDEKDLSKIIPDEEIKPSLLTSFTKEPEPVSKPKPQRESESPKNQASLSPMAPTGSMAIFISEGAQAGSGTLGIPLGTEIEAVIEQSVNANNHGIPVIAKVTGDFIRERKIVVPRGSRLFGETDGMSENQLGIRFSRIVFPSGEDHPFSGMTTVEGRLNRKGGSRGLAILSGAALGSTSVFAPQGAGFTDTFLRNAQRGSINEAGRDWNYYKSMEAMPVIKITANKKIRILVDRPL